MTSGPCALDVDDHHVDAGAYFSRQQLLELGVHTRGRHDHGADDAALAGLLEQPGDPGLREMRAATAISGCRTPCSW